MALTASSVISAAKKTSFGKRGRQKISDAALLEDLNHQDTLVVQMFSQIAPDLLSTVTGEEEVTLSENTVGYTLQAGIHYRDFVHVDEADDEYVPINIFQRQHRQTIVDNPAGMVQLSGDSGVFYPIDPDGDRWTGGGSRTWFDEDSNHKFTYSYTPVPGNLTALSDTLASPDMAKRALVASLEVSIVLANPTAQEIHIQTALAKRQGLWDALRMQAYKFVAPQGQRPGGQSPQTDSEWVHDQVSG